MKICKLTNEYKELIADFECGNFVIDRFLKDGSALDKNQGITYILLSDEKDFIIGYYNIVTGRIDLVESVNGIKTVSPMGGTINIQYLAIHSKYQHTKIAEIDGRSIYLGDYLLHCCEKEIMRIREKVGVAFITVYSTEQGYHLYHDRNSYEDFEDDMSTFVQESDMLCHKLYKYVDDIFI